MPRRGNGSHACQPVGPQEVARFLGVKRATVQQWGFRDLLPPRDYTISGQAAWELQTIIDWAVETGRLETGDPRIKKGLAAIA